MQRFYGKAIPQKFLPKTLFSLKVINVLDRARGLKKQRLKNETKK